MEAGESHETGAAAPDGAADDTPDQSAGVAATWTLIAAIWTIAVVLLAVVTPAGPISSLTVPWWVLAIGVWFTERYGIQLHARRDVHTVNLSELPLVLGLALLSPLGLVASRIAGVAASVVTGQASRRIDKIAFNIGMAFLEAVVAVAVYRLVLAGTDPNHLRGVVAALAAAISTQVVGAAAVTAVLTFHSGSRPRPRHVVQMLGSGLVGAVVATLLAWFALVVVWANPSAAWLLLVLAAITCWFFSVYGSLRQRYEDLRAVHAFAKAVAVAEGREETESVMLREACALLRAERAELVLASTEADGAGSRLSMTDDDGAVRRRAVPSVDVERLASRVDEQGTATVFGPDERSSVLRDLFVAQGYRDGVIVPLVRDGTPLGFLVVGDRLGPVAGFDGEDAWLLEIVAEHAATSLARHHVVERLRYEASHDLLTGLANRLRFNAAVAEALADEEARLAVVLLDLDRFKEVNDTLGHEWGDLLLCRVSDRLQRNAPREALIARLGGDEFAVLLPDSRDLATVTPRIESLLAAFAEPVAIGELTLEVGGSVGVALAPDHGDTPSALLQRADVAMYAAKRHGTRWEAYGSELDQHSPRRLTLAADLRTAISSGQMGVLYQPQARAVDGQVVGVEALARWDHPTLGEVDALDFVHAAEQTGVIRDLTLHVLATSLAAVRGWEDAGMMLSVAVNLSARSLIDVQLPDDVERLLCASRVPPQRLVLELTESTVMSDTGRSAAVLTRLANLGVRIAIDDFGTGYSSLRYLQRLPVGEVKIDRSFVTHLARRPSDEVIVASTVELARRLGLNVVAEGVEDQETWDRLLAMGCALVQGFHLSRPLSADDLTRWLLDRHTVEVPA